ncbi:MAG TPA: copper chaperone PCu(A)C [Burkholderiaceae bacterium]|nr:copper chaperone PCu(A)C [Burkholderiaceae bacterium]
MIRYFAWMVLLAWAGASHGQVQVKDAWARPALQGQTATGAFMSLMSNDGARLIGAASPVAGVVEIHEMVMEGSVMRMRAIAGLDLPPGRSVELKPGGYHVMLMDLKRPLKAGERVPLELRIETKDKRLVTQPIEVEVATRAPAAAGASAHKH